MQRIEIPDFDSAPLAPPFFLVVIDYDTRRFALEGPVDDLAPWEREATRIRRAGRDVWFVPVESHAATEMTNRLIRFGCEEWPTRFIVDLPNLGARGSAVSKP